MLTSTGNDGGAKACSAIQWKKSALEFNQSSAKGSEPDAVTYSTTEQKKLYQVNLTEPESLSVTNSGLDTHEEVSKGMLKVSGW